eukprot:scpid103088/ scgid26041/ 
MQHKATVCVCGTGDRLQPFLGHIMSANECNGASGISPSHEEERDNRKTEVKACSTAVCSTRRINDAFPSKTPSSATHHLEFAQRALVKLLCPRKRSKSKSHSSKSSSRSSVYCTLCCCQTAV